MIDWNYWFSFYTSKSTEQSNLLYSQSLNYILLPEIKNYFADFLTIPVNKKSENVYGVLKAYIMLGDSK